MQIFFDGSAEERQRLHLEAKKSKTKFGMFRKGDDVQAHIFGMHTQHSHFMTQFLHVHDGYEFIGAGFLKNGIAEWGSESCCEYFGFDRPEDEKQAMSLLEELQLEISAIF